MKKLSILLVIALLLLTLAGCRGSMGAGAQTPPAVITTPTETTVPVETTAPIEETAPPVETTTPKEDTPVSGNTENLITRDEAKKIALDHAKVKESEIRDLDIELDRDSGTLHYDVDFEKDGKDYDYEIDAKTGKILRSQTPAKTESNPKEDTTVSGNTENLITRDKAKKIALDHAKVKESEIRDLDIELDRDSGTLHYDVDFEKDGKDYDYEIDAKTGKILRSQTPAKTESKPKEETKELTATEARDKALKHAGVKATEVRDLEVDLDKDGGNAHYEITFEKDGFDYEYEIDAKTGAILKSEKERD